MWQRMLPKARDFNPRSHEGSDRYKSTNGTPHTNFNPRSHEGSDPVVQPKILEIDNFNPRSHEGSDY